MPRKSKADKRIFFRTMEDALTARNNASESVKNASEVKQAVLKKRNKVVVRGDGEYVAGHGYWLVGAKRQR